MWAKASTPVLWKAASLYCDLISYNVVNAGVVTGGHTDAFRR